MATSTPRLGRKINRPTGALRTPACAPCAQRRVRCDGGSPCQACLRLAAWKGRPAPAACDYDGLVPARKNGPLPPALAAYSNTEASTSTAVPSAQPPPPPARPPPLKERPTTSTSATGKKCRRSRGPALQKGLACLACKSRRIRCDGSKPACGACVRRQLRSGDELECVYRADLFRLAQEPGQAGGGGLEVETPRPEQEVGVDARAVVEEDEREYGMDLVVDEMMPPPPPPSSTFTHSPLSLLPSILPALPPLPSTSSPSTAAAAAAAPTSFPPYPLESFDAPSYFTSFPPRSSSLSSTASTSTFTPTATPTPSDLDLDELLSSCSSWPSSPRTPLFDPHAFATLLRRDNYPPVPYPPPPPPSALPVSTTTTAAALGAAPGINPHWTDAACALSSVPALELGALALYSWADVEPLTARPGGGDDREGGELGAPGDLVVGGCGGGGGGGGCEAQGEAYGEVGDVMLTLPIEPVFASEWSGTGGGAAR
ncbi:hypothetical protein JCM3775_003358 [Rhodotorula graminis]|uniref:Zn(2)-C6 fungal-type domain-containing protein n=1 Tax=Rhodotorula graminis (strain WP1) TaxID=578459 RepID=A0A0P9FA07_RHOGW|nr:uncharacterized protein RHOBADRAFT_55906 [Rhodotorula graminis WP1]KPV72441.1 hypothetical protein RHOBADRAFT_55906 [Rhodotorula graminis WP1]